MKQKYFQEITLIKKNTRILPLDCVSIIKITSILYSTYGIGINNVHCNAMNSKCVYLEMLEPLPPHRPTVSPGAEVAAAD